jgi:c(7)-type cytochrome triheme protein
MNHRKKLRGASTWGRHCVAAVVLAASICTLYLPVSAQESAEESTDASAPLGTASESVADPENATEFVGEMYQIGLGWHAAALEGLPTDKFGLVDWVAALEQGMIKPRSNIDPKGPEGVPFDMNILMPSKTGMIAGAYFPHKTHTTWMSCDSCHIKIFMPLAGSNDLTMSTIVKGQACGVCHGKVAFPLNDCTRCHVSHSDADDGGAAEQ